MTPPNRTPRTAADIIAAAFDHDQHTAEKLAALLTSTEREAVEDFGRTDGNQARLAALIYNAQLRHASALPPEQQRAARELALLDANRHHRRTCATTFYEAPENFARLKVYKTPAEPPEEDPDT